MSESKILHVGFCDKFIPPFIDFIEENINNSHHQFILRRGPASPALKHKKNIYTTKKTTLVHRFKLHIVFLLKAFRADKIILHGLFNTDLIAISIIQPWIYKKCFWVIWGGDLYDYRMETYKRKSQLKEFLKKLLVPKIGNIITDNEGDYKLAQQWYGAQGKLHRCFMYPSNLYTPLPDTKADHDGVNILLGNSATSTNNHIKALEKLSCFKDENIKIYCPLSYGDSDYADEIEKLGKDIFGEKFVSLRKFLPIKYYLDFLSEIDIAIFCNNRQQAMGTIRTLLGFGKKIYLNESTTSSKYFNNKGLKIFPIEDFSIDTKFPERSKNIKIIQSTFSKEKLHICLANIFNT